MMVSFLFAVFGIHIQGQLAVTGFDENQQAYFNSVSNHAIIYTGKIEPRYLFKILNHPYLDTDAFRKGTLSYDGVVYPDVMIRLNQNQEELIVLSPDKRFATIVPRDRVGYASIDSLYICYGKPESANGQVLPEGYYVRLHNQDCQVWKRELFLLNSNIKDMTLEYFFEKKSKYYIYKDHIYYPVNNKRSVLKLFMSKKKELRKFIRQQGLNFRNDPDRSIVAVTDYYESLNK